MKRERNCVRIYTPRIQIGGKKIMFLKSSTGKETSLSLSSFTFF